MSADNGVYILQTYGPEFRVCYGGAIDNIYEGLDSESNRWKPNMKEMRDMFCDSKMFSNLDEAWDYAKELAADHTYLEDGVCLITDFSNVKFGED